MGQIIGVNNDDDKTKAKLPGLGEQAALCYQQPCQTAAKQLSCSGHWELTADALTLTWQRGPVRFTVVESPGIYVALRPDHQTERLEKVADVQTF